MVFNTKKLLDAVAGLKEKLNKSRSLVERTRETNKSLPCRRGSLRFGVHLNSLPQQTRGDRPPYLHEEFSNKKRETSLKLKREFFPQVPPIPCQDLLLLPSAPCAGRDPTSAQASATSGPRSRRRAEVSRLSGAGPGPDPGQGKPLDQGSAGAARGPGPHGAGPATQAAAPWPSPRAE